MPIKEKNGDKSELEASKGEHTHEVGNKAQGASRCKHKRMPAKQANRKRKPAKHAPPVQVPMMPRPSHRAVTIYVCEQCGAASRTRANIVEHQEQFGHSGIKTDVVFE